MDTAKQDWSLSARRSERVRVHLPVTLIWHEGAQRQVERTYTVSVSRFGCQLHCRCSFPPGTPIRLEYCNRIILGRTSYCLKDYDTKLAEIGIGFDDDGTDFWGVNFE